MQYFSSIGASKIHISSIRQLSEEGHNRDFISFTLDTDDKLTYELGDALEIYPVNDHTRVSEFLHAYSPEFDERTVLHVHNFGISREVSVGCIFTNILDIFGKPTMHFLQQLATFEEDENVRRLMLDKDKLKKMTAQRGVTYADLLMEYKSAHPPLEALLSMIPPIKGRAYSITSSPSVTPNSIELCILIDTWWCDEGMRRGLTCDMLRKLCVGDFIQCRVKPGSMEPPTHDQSGKHPPINITLLCAYFSLLSSVFPPPVVCVGIGSGLAPHLSFLRDRVNAAENGIKVAPFSLYFGNRFEKREFLYRDELEDILSKHGSWFKLHTAFSRDTVGKKVYVQDLVAIQDDAYQNLVQSPGMLYVCGNRNLPKPLMESLKKSFARGMECASGNGEVMADASKAVEDMYIHGSAQQEVW